MLNGIDKVKNVDNVERLTALVTPQILRSISYVRKSEGGSQMVERRLDGTGVLSMAVHLNIPVAHLI